MRDLRILCLAVLAGGCALSSAMPQAHAQKPRNDEYPNSIMREEPARPVPKAKPRRHGSSSPSPVPPYRSVVTPLGTAPRIIETRPPGHPGSPPMVVPGVSGNAGPAFTPPRPAGQSFQDRATSCLHAGSAAGVPPGQIGAYTRSCVNQ